MTFADLASIGNLTSGVAVLISLVYLGLQMRQSARHSQALIQQGRASRTMEILTRWAEFDWSEGMEACVRGSPDVDARDLRRFISLMRAYFVNYEDSFLQHREGLLEAAAFANVEAALYSTMTGPGHRAAWKVVRGAFDRAFQDYLDGVIADTTAAPFSSTLERWKDATAPAAAPG
jgi:hypothetical protein